MGSTFHPWHDDLHAENVFVDGDNPAEILSVIDWQSSFIDPLFDYNVSPAYLDYDGPAVHGIEEPSYPKLSDSPSTKERAMAGKLYDEQMLAYGFRRLLQNNIQPAFDAIQYREDSEGSDVLSPLEDCLSSAKLTVWPQLRHSNRLVCSLRLSWRRLVWIFGRPPTVYMS